MAEVVTIVATCCEMLVKTFTIIDKITTALDRNKNGAKHLGEIGTQVRITKKIIDSVVKNDKNDHKPAVLAAVDLVKKKAEELEGAARDLKKNVDASKMKAFLDEVFRGDSRAEKFERLQRELTMAQTALITALVVFNDNGAHKDINIGVVEKVNNCFRDFSDIKSDANYAQRLLDLISERGQPLGKDGTICRISTEDLEKLMQNLPWSDGKIVRIFRNTEVTDYGFASADVGKEGEDAPHVDTVIAEGCHIRNHGYMAAGPIDFNAEQRVDKALSFIPGWDDSDRTSQSAGKERLSQDKKSGQRKGRGSEPQKGK